MSRTKVAIIAALEREVWPLVKKWRYQDKNYDGRQFRFFEYQDVVLVCGGIGPGPARRATEAAIVLYGPQMVKSVGFAGALAPEMKAGTVLVPGPVVDASDGSRVEVDGGCGTLVSFSSVAGKKQKAKLAAAYDAKALDMEAAAVAKSAQKHNLHFSVVKVISDEVGFETDFTGPFVSTDGQLQTVRLVLHVLVRPWLWRRLVQLARDSSVASQRLCEWLGRDLHTSSLKHTPEVGKANVT